MPSRRRAALSPPRCLSAATSPLSHPRGTLISPRSRLAASICSPSPLLVYDDTPSRRSARDDDSCGRPGRSLLPADRGRVRGGGPPPSICAASPQRHTRATVRAGRWSPWPSRCQAMRNAVLASSPPPLFKDAAAGGVAGAGCVLCHVV